MNKKHLCVFDLDGTLYPKESSLTYYVRKQVIASIAIKNNITFSKASELYFKLPNLYINPYKGLMSLGITPNQYRDIYNNTCVKDFVQKDEKLIKVLKQLRTVSIIIILSLAPKKYVVDVLVSLGISDFVDDIISVNKQCDYSKEQPFMDIISKSAYSQYYSVGDDFNNDIVPSKKAGYLTYQVDFDNKSKTIYSIIEHITDSIKNCFVPSTMRVENIAFCNLKCNICPYADIKRHKGIMTDYLFEKIINEHSSVTKNPKLIFPASVGEPFLDDKFLKRVEFASKKYTTISTFTNATMLSKDNFLKYVNNGGNELMLTLHGFTKSSYELITKSNEYDRVYNNIVSIAKINHKINNPITIYLDVYSAKSVQCDRFIDEMNEYGLIAQHINLNQIHNWGGVIPKSKRIRSSINCERIHQQFGVLYDGTVVPCCIDYEGNYPLGNANNSSLVDIFSSLAYQTLLENDKAKSLHDHVSICKYCNIN